jgi:hypothetical protein
LKERMSSSKRQTPNEFLKKIVGKPVVVKLNSGADYRGILFTGQFHAKTFFVFRNPIVPGRIHEHCLGANGRVLWRAA